MPSTRFDFHTRASVRERLASQSLGARSQVECRSLLCPVKIVDVVTAAGTLIEVGTLSDWSATLKRVLSHHSKRRIVPRHPPCCCCGAKKGIHLFNAVNAEDDQLHNNNTHSFIHTLELIRAVCADVGVEVTLDAVSCGVFI